MQGWKAKISGGDSFRIFLGGGNKTRGFLVSFTTKKPLK